jgi:hypothetical protein
MSKNLCYISRNKQKENNMNLNELHIHEIFAIAKQNGIKNVKKYLKRQLIEMLEALELDNEVQDSDVFVDYENASLVFMDEPPTDGYIVTCVLPNAPIHMPTIHALDNLAKEKNYRLVIYPVKWGTTEVNIQELPSIVQKYLVTANTSFANTTIHGDLNINANAGQPLSQIAGFAADNNVVIPHPVVYAKTTAASSYKNVKILMTTGTISDVEHSLVNSRVSATTKFHASLGGTVITSSNYPVVHYGYDKELGGIQVEDQVFGANTSTRYEAIYLPDMHLAHPNPIYMHSLLTEIKTLKPGFAVGGDLFDGSALCHHEKNRLGWSQHKISLTKELHLLDSFANTIHALTGQNLRMIIGNHETFADRFFSANFFQELAMYDREDSLLILEALTEAFRGTTHTDAGVKYNSMIKHWVKDMSVTVVNSELSVGNTNLGHHGNEYNTRKAGVRQANIKMVVGHVHAPSIDRNLTCVGYGGHPEPTYQSGLTMSAPAHCLVSPSGKRTLKIYQYS